MAASRDSQYHEAIIVGAGIVGCSCALHLAEAGLEVLLIESDKLASKATGRSAGELAVYRSDNPDDETSTYSKEFFNDLEQRHDSVEIQRNIRYKIAHSEEGYEALRRVHSQSKTGELLTPSELAAREPEIEAEGVTAAHATPNAHTDPYSLTAAIFRDCKDASVVLREGEPVIGLEKDGVGFTVKTNKGTYTTNRLVNATGAWSKQIAAKLDVTIPLKPRTSQLAVFELDNRLDLPSFACPDLNIYGRQEANDDILVGGGSSAAITDLDTFSTKAREPFIREIADALPKVARPLASARLKNSWAGRNSATPKRRPMIGETRLDGFYVCAGFNGLGISKAPFAGRLLADSVVGRESQFETGRFDPKQYSGEENIRLLGSSTDW